MLSAIGKVLEHYSDGVADSEKMLVAKLNYAAATNKFSPQEKAAVIKTLTELKGDLVSLRSF